MPGSEPAPLILSMGEPMVEFTAVERGPLKDAATFARGFGGDTSNFAVAVARLGGQAAYLCRIGDDEFGQALMDLWAREGVDTSRVRVVPGGYTGVYFMSWRPDGVHDFAYVRRGSAASTLSPEDLSPEQFRGVRLFHTSGITQAISTSACDAVFRALELAREAGAWLSYDPNLRLRLWPLKRARGLIIEAIRHADIVLPNIEEARAISGMNDPEANLDYLLGRGPRIVALKLGEHGCLVGTADGARVHAPAVRVPVVDTGGAGDTFDAAFAIGLVSGHSLEWTTRFAAAAAALTTTGKGCVTPIPRREAVLQLMAGGSGL
ncbi:MAG: sugar kinase [Bacillota bacterium]